ncbi:MAG: hypothetical protein Hals2KO_37760 [Halioglobus sp.]
MSREHNRGSVLRASAGALCAALVLLVTVVLPAEYGWDPLGTGARLGLGDLSEEYNNALASQAFAWQADQRQFQLAPFEAVEFKYRLEAGAALLYDWQAQDAVLFDMHAEPDGAAPGYAQSFEKARAARRQGSYVAPFSGIHGWFWQNRTQRDITVTLRVQGFFRAAKELRDGHEFEYGFQAREGEDRAPGPTTPRD